MRTHHCGELRLKNEQSSVTLCGWVQEVRDTGHLIWIDLRDRYGITQLILSKDMVVPALMAKARTLGREYVLQVSGKVIARSAKNPHIPTGEIEVVPDSIDVLSASETPPFVVADKMAGKETLHMQYRYLDLRRKPLQENLQLRHQVVQAIHRYFDQHGFIEVETPLLVKSTPEGARDFVVPSRLHPGEHYALPQSPQLFKQLLMVSGMDRYYQIAKCFRDEDLRADRQPEFTQIDCELSFITPADIYPLFTDFIRHIFQTVKGIALPPFLHMTYQDAMEKYGTDKPDLRWDMPFVPLTDLVKGNGFVPFDNAALVIGIKLPNGATYTRKKLDQWQRWLKENYLATTPLIYVKALPEGYKSSVAKFYTDADTTQWAEKAMLAPGDMLLLLGGEIEYVREAMAALIRHIIAEEGIAPSQPYAPLWITDFPLLTFDEERQAYHAVHHPFAAPVYEDIPLLATDPGKVRAQAYDLVINGAEIGGGSIRIHQKELQNEIFQLLGLDENTIKRQFGFLLNAFRYGVPPHGGIAFGLARLCALLNNDDAIRHYIAFPKNNSGRDTMLGAPAPL